MPQLFLANNYALSGTGAIQHLLSKSSPVRRRLVIGGAINIKTGLHYPRQRKIL
jgi:hypothetical protein